MERSVVLTADGSSSVFVPHFDEYYHSVHGALQESVHVFIDAGFLFKINNSKELSILEIGFGTGLNTFLTFLEAEKYNAKIDYIAIEKFPLERNIFEALHFNTITDDANKQARFMSMHTLEWNKKSKVNTHFSLTKLHIDVLNFKASNRFDIIYFDAFAPTAQKELWTTAVFTAMYDALKNEGVLVTYCAKGEVKRILKSVGFVVQSLPGPIGKREMTRAIKLNK